jgi:hypothetical protein
MAKDPPRVGNFVVSNLNKSKPLQIAIQCKKTD